MIEAIKKRRSVRTYKNKVLLKDDQKKIHNVIDEVLTLKGPFGNQIKLFFYDKPYVGKEQSIQIGTYGFVKNAKSFIAGSVLNTFEGIVDYGYLFEILILKLTDLDLGTVWLGGTFNREDFGYLLDIGEVIPAITPVGYPAEKLSIRESIMRNRIKADQRKSYQSLFFDQNFDTPLDENHSIAEYLDLVRIGPSASNKQPWRIIVDGNKVHFYLERTPNYGLDMPFDVQALDMGIAISHFEAGLIEDKKTYALLVDSNHPEARNREYVISCECIKNQNFKQE